MPATLTPTPADVDLQLVHAAAVLRDRATSLRTQADALGDLLASAYRRRAAELELEAWVAELQSGVPETQVRSAA